MRNQQKDESKMKEKMRVKVKGIKRTTQKDIVVKKQKEGNINKVSSSEIHKTTHCSFTKHFRHHCLQDYENYSTAKVIVFQPSNQFSTNKNKGYMKLIVIWVLPNFSHPHSLFSLYPCLLSLSTNCEQKHQSKWQFTVFAWTCFN